MRQKLNIWVIGGDQRQVRLAEQLAADGHTAHAFALERAEEVDTEVEQEKSLDGVELADCIVLPLPVTGEGSLLNTPLSSEQFPLAGILNRLSPGQMVCAGRVNSSAESLAAARGITLHDYFAREELAIANAVPTA